MKTLGEIRDFIGYLDRTYNNYRYKLRKSLDRPYGVKNPDLGYCWMYNDDASDTTTYNIVVAKTGIERLDLRVTYHEYLHCYLGHLEDHLTLDENASLVLKNERGQLVDSLKESCGLDEDTAMTMIEAIIDDPELNHTIHNIAEDMAVNSFIGLGGIKEMEEDINSIKVNLQAEFLKAYRDTLKSKRLKKRMDGIIDETIEAAKSKFIHPSRYHYPDGRPWEEGKTYQEYFLMIIRNLDQLLKSSANRNSGGNGDTSGTSGQDVQDALGGGGLEGLKQLLRKLGMSGGSGDSGGQGDQDGQPNSGDETEGDSQSEPELSQHDTSNSGGFRGDNEEEEHWAQGVRDPYFMDLSEGRKKDHYSPSRKKADDLRSLGQIKAGGGRSIGDSGGPEYLRSVTKTNQVDLAIDEIMLKYRKRVIKRTVVRDVMRNYNLGRCKTVIVPSIVEKYRIDTNPKVTYIIDISSSMDTVLIDFILNTIAHKMKYLNHGLKYDILTWSHGFGEWIKDIEPGKPIPTIHTGGGTRMADALKFVKDNYDNTPIFILISDFEDRLDEWKMVLRSMLSYTVYGFNYGTHNYKEVWPKNFIVKNFNKSYINDVKQRKNS